MSETPQLLQALEDRRIGFIGCGAMAQALAGGLVSAGLDPSRLSAPTRPPPSVRAGSRASGWRRRRQREPGRRVRFVVLCVKPGMIGAVLDSIARRRRSHPSALGLHRSGCLPRALAASLPQGARIVRTMPNTPALVGAGATALFAGSGVTADGSRRSKPSSAQSGSPGCAPTRH